MGQFNWDALSTKLQDNAMGDNKKSYEVDSRFYRLSRDENGVGGALIRFLTDPDDLMFVHMTLINAQQGRGKPFISEPSPLTIGKPDPVNERFSEVWKSGAHEEAKKYGRKFRWYTNIKVIKDPANPENEGKYFLFDMPKTLFDKLKDAAQPSETDTALEQTEAIEVYDPIIGHNFLVKAKIGSNKFVTYEDSKFSDKASALFKDEATAIKEIDANTYKLSEFLEPEYYMSYDDLVKKLKWFDGEPVEADPSAEAKAETPDAKAPEAKAPAAPAAVATVAKAAPVAKESTEDESFDELLDELMEE